MAAAARPKCGPMTTALQVWITDRGAGIQMAELPRVTLEKGYSTKGSLGHGFWMMLRSADSVHLTHRRERHHARHHPGSPARRPRSDLAA